MPEEHWNTQVEALGDYIRAQRKLASLSLRELAALSNLSNAYLSPLERGLHEPSMRVITQLSRALGVSVESLLQGAGVLDDEDSVGAAGDEASGAEQAILRDPNLSADQKAALLAVYRGFATDGE
jgi:transcriptional regulator with XRE-family HTH domain